VIDNFFVSGDRQATFARKLGYPNPLQGYYSANSLNNDYSKSKNRANRFVFVGRLVKEKNIQILVDAYKDYRSSVESPWELVICGRGDLEYLCKDTEGIQLMNFVQPQELCQILLESKCLVHPSLFEPWGLVIHEAALAGLAIISSFQTGASTAFVRDGVNGFIVNPGIYEISRSMYLITKKSEAQFEEMSNASKSLGNLWTTQKWADYVYNYVCLNRKLK
jgi:glycosyltransferase involved in cell wall biosynthesis